MEPANHLRLPKPRLGDEIGNFGLTEREITYIQEHLLKRWLQTCVASWGRRKTDAKGEAANRLPGQTAKEEVRWVWGGVHKG